MSECRQRLESTVGVPRQALGDEVNKELVVRFQHLGKRLGSWSASLALGVDDRSGGALRVCDSATGMECVSKDRLSTKRRGVKELTEEDILARTLINDVLVGQTEDLHDARQLLLLVLSREDGEAGVELGEDAA